MLSKAAQQWPKQAEDVRACQPILEDILAHNYNEETGVLMVGIQPPQTRSFIAWCGLIHCSRTGIGADKDRKWLDSQRAQKPQQLQNDQLPKPKQVYYLISSG